MSHKKRLAIILFCILGTPAICIGLGVIKNDGSGLSILFGIFTGLTGSFASAVLGLFLGLFITDDTKYQSLAGYIIPSILAIAYMNHLI